LDESGQRKSRKQRKKDMVAFKAARQQAEEEAAQAGEDLHTMVSVPALFGIDLTIQKGETIAVVGPVGSGKSTLLSAMLGELSASPGSRDLLQNPTPVCVDGTVAYCAQQPWIRNGLLKENVLFGSALNTSKYREAIRVSAMESDIDTITGGHNAEIGERGINLSGGQKARVSLGMYCIVLSVLLLILLPMLL
jgi:ATP-binding cassette subfamily C (CFTR/MRP) protein 1